MLLSISLCLLLGLIVLFWVCGSLSLAVMWMPITVSVGELEFLWCIDYVVILSIFMLSVCSCLAFVYCFHYYYGSSDAFLLFILMFLFVVVMAVLIISGSFIFTLVMWEYLGFLSFLLILFYSNSSSLRASLVTLFSSRFGDVGLFVVLVHLLTSYEIYGWFFFFSFFLVVISKSASFPFVSWLLEAMRAPTPVSSLVHSSTLVAAGVWFVVRYDYVSFGMGYWVFIVSLFTIFLTSLCSLFFFDLKKIVALSTCNNVAWCLLFYSCGDLFLVMCQLLVHGVCKCSLFILVGDLMSSSGGSQSSIAVYLSRYSGFYGVTLLTLLVFCLCGLPFIGIFFLKHFFFLCLVGGVCNILLVLFVLVGFMFSYIYSFRLSLLVCSGVSGISGGYLVSFVFVGYYVLVGTLFGWLFFGILEEFGVLSVLWSLVFLLVLLLGSFIGFILYDAGFLGWFWQSLLCGNDSLVGFFYSMCNNIAGFCLLGLYRVEVLLMVMLSRYFIKVVNIGMFVFSLNFIVFGVIVFVFLVILL